MNSVNVTIDGNNFWVDKTSTILDVATASGIEIPTLCKIKQLDPTANCRMCVVEVEGARTLQTACSTRVSDGMNIRTATDKIKRSRKMSLELLLSRHAVDCHHCLRNGHSKSDDLDPDFCEMCFFCDCIRDGFCELQELAREYKVDLLPFDVEPDNHIIDDSTKSIIRNGNKCINCRRCVSVCGEVQQIHNLVVANRGSEAKIEPSLGVILAESECIQCGRCVTVCPTGAIHFKEDLDELLYYTHDYTMTTVAQISEDILPALATLFGVDVNDVSFEKVAGGLRKIGVDYVYPDSYTKSLSNNEGQAQVVYKLNNENGPFILTKSRAAFRFIERHHAGLINHVVLYPSSQEMFGSYVREGFLADKGLKGEKVKTISISDSPEDPVEAKETGSVDFCLNSRQLYRLFLRTGVDITNHYQNSLCDNVFLSKQVEHSDLFQDTDWSMDKSHIDSKIGLSGKSLKVATATNLGQSARLLREMASEKSEYDIIRIV